MEPVIQEHVGDFYVSTVKLPFDHGFGDVPLLYETMIFPKGKWIELYLDRYSTEEEAREGHVKAVAQAQTMEENNEQYNYN